MVVNRISLFLRFALFVGLSLTLIECTVIHTISVPNDQDFTVYENNQSSPAVRIDGTTIPDQRFSIKLIKGWLYRDEIGSSYIHEFDYPYDQKIITIYSYGYLKYPKSNTEKLNVNRRQFLKLASENGIDLDSDLEGIKIRKGRTFGLKVLNEGRFVIMYLNVHKKAAANYNYSIRSLVLK